MALYKIVGGGPFSRWESTSYGEEQRTYVVGDTVELDPAEAERMNREIAKVDRDARRVELAGVTDFISGQLPTPIPYGLPPGMSMVGSDQAPSEAGAVVTTPTNPTLAPGIVFTPEQCTAIDALAGTTPSAPIVTEGIPATASAEDAAAPDWATYLAATGPSEACAEIATLTSPDDIRAALTAERAGAKRPRIIKAAVARLKELGATVAG